MGNYPIGNNFTSVLLKPNAELFGIMARSGGTMLKKLLLLITVGLFAVHELPASGFTVYEQSASATAVAGAVVASVDDASAVFFNPAAINNNPGVHVSLGVSVLNSLVGFIGPSTIDAKKYNKSRRSELNLSHLYVTYKYNDILSAGFGFYSPFAIKTNWQRNGENWEGQNLVQNYNLDTYVYNPVIAVNVFDYASVALGISYVQADMGLTNTVFFVPRAINGSSSLDASGNGFGFNMAVKAEPLPGLHLGLSYRSGVEIDYSDAQTSFDDGGTNDETIRDEFFSVYPEQVKTKFKNNLPSLFAIGLAYDFTPNLTFEADYLLSGYGSLDDVRLKYSALVNGSNQQTLNQSFKDTYSMRFGIKYKVDDQLTLRTGYFYDDAMADDVQANPMIPDMQRHNYSVGFGYRMAGFAVDGFYQVTLPDDRTVTGTESNFDGTYSGLITMYGMTLGYSF